MVRQRSILLVLKNHNEMESLVKWKQNAMESLVIEKEEFKSEKVVFERGVSKWVCRNRGDMLNNITRFFKGNWKGGVLKVITRCDSITYIRSIIEITMSNFANKFGLSTIEKFEVINI